MSVRAAVAGLALGLAALAAAPAMASTTPIVADVSAAWTHAGTGMTFSPTLGGFAREGIEDFGAGQLDIAASYGDPGSGTVATLYVFHAGLADVSVWHDRILSVIGMGALGTPDRDHALAAVFTPAGQGAESGLRTTMAMAGRDIAASGVAVFAHDDWLVVVRMSSHTLAPAALDARLAGFVGALAVPAAKVAAPAAYRIAACGAPMPTAAATRLPSGADPQTLAGLLVSIIDVPREPGRDAAPAPQPRCRDRDSGVQFGLYHGGDPAAGFTVAIGDDGNAVTVAPDLIAKAHGLADHYTVTLATVDKRIGYAGFAGLPTLAQVAGIVGHERPVIVYVRAVNGGKGQINIMTPTT